MGVAYFLNSFLHPEFLGISFASHPLFIFAYFTAYFTASFAIFAVKAFDRKEH
jgi:hypothetical protein